MARVVIKSFRDLQDNEKLYSAPGGQGERVYKGDREEELFNLGYLGEKVKDKNDITVDEIKAELDKQGIKYKSNAKKADLLELLGV